MSINLISLLDLYIISWSYSILGLYPNLGIYPLVIINRVIPNNILISKLALNSTINRKLT